MHHLSAIDELAEIRAEIARLKHREAALRKQIIASPPGGRYRPLAWGRGDGSPDPVLRSRAFAANHPR